jgi:hypothetical protein
MRFNFEQCHVAEAIFYKILKNFVPEKWIRFFADSALLEDVGSQTHLALVNNTNNRRRDTALKIDEVKNHIQREELPTGAQLPHRLDPHTDPLH